ncbi:MAG: efflux RND transporter permease subunit [Minwuiales bacterium]|nr:efflux RND transporter permease subunit [Minwuiales bacterium]
MNLIRLAIERPIAVVSAVIMAVMFGAVALATIPIQLTPDVRRPIITITTTWFGAAPAEVEREIVNRQEEVLKGVEGLEEMVSRSRDGEAEVTLEFRIDQNMDRALLLVANRLDRVDGYPDEADEPILSTSGSEDSAIAWFILTRAEGNDKEIHSFGDFGEDAIQDRLERVAGVSRTNLFGGSEREMQVTVLPERMARYGLTVPQVVDALRRANISVSAGDVNEGKRRYVVRTEGEFTEPSQVADVILRSVNDPVTGRLARVTVGDIAEIGFGYKEPTARIRYLGQPAIAINAIRETGANVIDTMVGIREAVEGLNAFALPNARLVLEQVYDETVYIVSAIDLVIQNIYIGGVLAAIILLLFLRSFGATLIISVAIPVSVIASFVAMAAMGRSINVISLAGIAFAVGMVVDAAIVVLENIYRLRQAGRSSAEAAYEGARQVWGAVLVSALTTVMVFIPILVMKLEVGQLFRDIAVAISVAVILSLVVAITLIPAMSRRLLGGPSSGSLTMRRLPVIDDLAALFAGGVMAFTRVVVASRPLAFVVVATVATAAGVGSYLYLPKLEYLPEGNRNLVFGIILPPPGYNLDTTTEIAEQIEGSAKPLWAIETGPESEPGQPPKVENFFFVATRATTFLGATAVDGQRAGELIGPLSQPIFREPGTFGFLTQPSLFGRGIGGGRSIELNISGPDLEQILGIALQATGMVSGILPREEGHQLRPIPGLELGAPEVRLYPDRVRLADSGVTARDLGMTVNAFNDGLRVAEITVDGKRIDLTLIGPVNDAIRTQGIDALPVVTESGQILPAASLADIRVTSGPTEIRHLERERTVTLEIRPTNQLPLEAAMEILQAEVIDKIEAGGLPPGVKLGLSGTADQLTQTWDAMVLNLALAIAIVYLVMAVLFESFVYPLIILISVPLAAAGGVGGLAILNLFTYQALDMLTLLGFVILIGIVVNNAILLVHQTLYHLREEGLEPQQAILAATRNRLRPIFMSTLTSVVGMLPLVLFPGAGSELYRGLGSVVVGGLSLSAVLTLLLIPPMLTVFLTRRSARAAPASAEAAPAE